MAKSSMNRDTATQQGLTFSASKWIHPKTHEHIFEYIIIIFFYLIFKTHSQSQSSTKKVKYAVQIRLPVTVQILNAMTTIAARLFITVVLFCIFSTDLCSFWRSWLTVSLRSRHDFKYNKKEELISVRVASTVSQEHNFLNWKYCFLQSP